jgi:response regulator RpfG family c-di-GMP phosphodiesterase
MHEADPETVMNPDERRHTLLIVDDEPALLQSLRHQFCREYRVLTAENGRDALDLLGREEVHTILTDQRMPGMTGDAFLAQARHVKPDAVRMLFTGYADIQAVIGAVNEGRIFRYILKPWDPTELEGIVRQAVEHHDLKVDRKRLIAELKEANENLMRVNRELTDANELKRAMLDSARLRADFEELSLRVSALEGAAIPKGPERR